MVGIDKDLIFKKMEQVGVPSSAHELSVKTGLSYTAIRDILYGDTTSVRFSTLDVLATALKLPPGQIIKRFKKPRAKMETE